MKKTKALVLGGNGFIGSNLCQCLKQKGYEVYSFDRRYPETMDEQITYIQGDFFDDEILKEAVEGKDIIYHGISTIIPGNSNEQYMRGYSKDFIQTIKLCEMIQESHAKMIFLSSGGTVYGKQEKMPIIEEAATSPINHYGNVKLCIENVIKVFNLQRHTKTLIARIANPYGPGQDYKKGVGFIDAAIKRVLSDEPIEIWGDGMVIRDYIYIKDVCEMLYQLSKYDGPEEVFNLSSNTGVSQNNIIDILKEIHGKDSVIVKYEESRSVDVKEIILDNNRILSLLEEPVTTISEGVECYYEFIKKSVEFDSKARCC